MAISVEPSQYIENQCIKRLEQYVLFDVLTFYIGFPPFGQHFCEEGNMRDCDLNFYLMTERKFITWVSWNNCHCQNALTGKMWNFMNFIIVCYWEGRKDFSKPRTKRQSSRSRIFFPYHTRLLLKDGSSKEVLRTLATSINSMVKFNQKSMLSELLASRASYHTLGRMQNNRMQGSGMSNQGPAKALDECTL